LTNTGNTPFVLPICSFYSLMLLIVIFLVSKLPDKIPIKIIGQTKGKIPINTFS